MIEIDGVKYRNLQEQVRANQDAIEDFRKSGEFITDYGLNIVGQVERENDLPDPSTYAGQYGDAFLVGTEGSFKVFLFTQPFEGDQYPHWADLGNFPAPGPQGPQGPMGEKGETGRGNTWRSAGYNPVIEKDLIKGDHALNTMNGNVFEYDGRVWQITGSIEGPQGIQGIQGPQGAQGIQGIEGKQGPKGEPGQAFRIAGTLNSTTLLPDPKTTPDYIAYLVGTKQTKYELYVQLNDVWTNVGVVSGVQGPKGDKGDTGAQGPVGPQGKQGETGPQGPRGEQGIQGIKGETGAKGETGPAGPQGKPGPQGAKGDRGSVGPVGDTGPAGPVGPTAITYNGVIQSRVNFISDPQGQINILEADIAALDGSKADIGTVATNAENIAKLGTDKQDKLSQTDLDNIASINDIWAKIYPVGSIYISAGSAKPTDLFGGDWVKLENRFLLGAGSSYTLGKTGGEATHKLTINEMPSHSHNVLCGTQLGENDLCTFGATAITTATGAAQPTGGNAAHNNMPPYLVVNMWKRIS